MLNVLSAVIHLVGARAIESLVYRNSKCQLHPKWKMKLRELSRVRRRPWEDFITSDNFKLQSPEAWNLLDGLLEVNSTERLSAAEALQHPYFAPVRQCWKDIPDSKYDI